MNRQECRTKRIDSVCAVAWIPLCARDGSVIKWGRGETLSIHVVWTQCALGLTLLHNKRPLAWLCLRAGVQTCGRLQANNNRMSLSLSYLLKVSSRVMGATFIISIIFIEILGNMRKFKLFVYRKKRTHNLKEKVQ